MNNTGIKEFLLAVVGERQRETIGGLIHEYSQAVQEVTEF
jgi:hypothetical protein